MSTTAIETKIDRFRDGKAYKNFLNDSLEAAGEDSLIAFSMPVQRIDPLACLELLGKPDAYQFYWEKPEDDFALAGGGCALRLQASGENRFSDMGTQVERVSDESFSFSTIQHPHTGLHFLGGFAFFDRVGDSAWQSFGSSTLAVPEWMVVTDGELSLLTLAFRASDYDGSADLDRHLARRLENILPTLDLDIEIPELPASKKRPADLGLHSRQEYQQWEKAVNSAKELIDQQTFEKIVLARKITTDIDSETQATHIAHRLRRQYANCFTFLVHDGEGNTFIGCSPERLASFHKNYILTEALAGSIRRGASATEDAVLEKELHLSSKNAMEHNYVVQAIEQRLKRVTRKIERGSRPIIKKMANVQHLFTPITAWLKKQAHPLDILGSLHPTPAVGGYPWKKAAPYIQQLENFDRGWYAGPVGWLNDRGRGDFAVGIRSGLLENGDGKGHYYAGCGIVADSDAESEWRETNLKFTPMLSAYHHD